MLKEAIKENNISLALKLKKEKPELYDFMIKNIELYIKGRLQKDKVKLIKQLPIFDTLLVIVKGGYHNGYNKNL